MTFIEKKLKEFEENYLICKQCGSSFGEDIQCGSKAEIGKIKSFLSSIFTGYKDLIKKEIEYLRPVLPYPNFNNEELNEKEKAIDKAFQDLLKIIDKI